MHVSVVRESALTSPRRSSWHECQWLGCICIARLTEATRSPTRIPTSSDPADGSFLPSDSDTTGFIGGVLGGGEICGKANNPRGRERSSRGTAEAVEGAVGRAVESAGEGGVRVRGCAVAGGRRREQQDAISRHPAARPNNRGTFFLDFYHLYGSYPDIKMHTSAAAMLCLPVYPLPMHTAHFVWQHAYTQQPSSEQKYPISR